MGKVEAARTIVPPEIIGVLRGNVPLAIVDVEALRVCVGSKERETLRPSPLGPHLQGVIVSIRIIIVIGLGTAQEREGQAVRKSIGAHFVRKWLVIRVDRPLVSA